MDAFCIYVNRIFGCDMSTIIYNIFNPTVITITIVAAAITNDQIYYQPNAVRKNILDCV